MSRGGSHSREPSPRLVMLVLFLVSIPVGVAFFSILRILSWLTTPLLFTTLALFFLFTAVSAVFQMSLANAHPQLFHRSLYP